MPHLAKVGVCWQAAHEGRTSYWILGSPSPPPLGESGIRYNLRVSENFCDPQYQGQEIKWNYVTLPTYAAKGPEKNLCCQEQKHQKISCQPNPPSFPLQWWLMLAFGISCSKMIELIIMIENCMPRVGNSLTMMMKTWRQCQLLQLITFRVIRMGMIYIFVQIGRALNRPAAGSATNWEKTNVVKYNTVNIYTTFTIYYGKHIL